MIFPSRILVSRVLRDFLFGFHLTSCAKHSIPLGLAVVFLKTVWTYLLPLWSGPGPGPHHLRLIPCLLQCPFFAQLVLPSWD